MTPHYLRFARSLALLGGLGAVSGCSATNTPSDSGTSPGDAPRPAQDAFSAEDAAVLLADAFTSEDAPAGPDDAFDICTTCMCVGGGGGGGGGEDAGRPDCFTVPGAEICCAVIGPLYPPELAV